MFKKLLFVLVLAGGAFAIVKRRKAAQEERDLWHEATAAADLR